MQAGPKGKLCVLMALNVDRVLLPSPLCMR